MKNKHYEKLGRQMRDYHRQNDWKLSQGGLFIPHTYPSDRVARLSFWADVGFILNRRRVIVWWRHPRDVYLGAIEQMAWQEVGEWAEPHHSAHLPSKASEKVRHYQRLREAEIRMVQEGIDYAVKPSWKWNRLSWGMGMSLVTPVEVNSTKDLAGIAALARQLILSQTTLSERFPTGYAYDRADWLGEIRLESNFPE